MIYYATILIVSYYFYLKNVTKSVKYVHLVHCSQLLYNMSLCVSIRFHSAIPQSLRMDSCMASNPRLTSIYNPVVNIVHVSSYKPMAEFLVYTWYDGIVLSLGICIHNLNTARFFSRLLESVYIATSQAWKGFISS